MGVQQTTRLSPEMWFYDLKERDYEVMADRGFQIQVDLLHFCRLVVPPGARVKSQMTKSEVKISIKFANS